MNCSSNKTEEIIRLYYEAFNAGDSEGMLRLLDAAVAHGINQGEVVTGAEAFREFLADMDKWYEEKVEDLVVMVNESGKRAAAEFFIRGKYVTSVEGLPPANGQTYHLRVGAFFEVADGHITRVTNYYNMQDWLQQVGA
jgi:steroid delta-isomerase-like uncharacterized protein